MTSLLVRAVASGSTTLPVTDTVRSITQTWNVTVNDILTWAATLPQAWVDTTYPTIDGTTTTVGPSGRDYTDVQAAIDHVVSVATDAKNYEIVLDAGVAWTNTYNLRTRTSGSGYIVIRTSGLTSLPTYNDTGVSARVDPTYLSYLATVKAPAGGGPAIRTEANAHHYRLVGLEVTAIAGVHTNYGLVMFGDPGDPQVNDPSTLPHHLIADRCYVHGGPDMDDARRGIAMNCASGATVQCYISDIKALGADCQAIGGWAGPGPFRLHNSYFEASCENVMFGGAPAGYLDCHPSDITITCNHFYKPVGWLGTYDIKNILEFKHAIRVLAEGNVFENCPAANQNGYAFQWKSSATGDAGAALTETRDITFCYNIVRNSDSGWALAAAPDLIPCIPSSRISITHNLCYNFGGGALAGGDRRIFEVLSGPDVTYPYSAVRIRHNTLICDPQSPSAMLYLSGTLHGVDFRDNIATLGAYGLFGDGSGSGTAALTAHVSDGTYAFTGNALIGSLGVAYPSGNFNPATTADVGFTNPSTNDYSLAAGSACKAGGTWQASDGTDNGADIATILTKTSGVVQAHG